MNNPSNPDMLSPLIIVLIDSSWFVHSISLSSSVISYGEIHTSQLSGDYTVSVFDEKVEFANEQFTISEEEGETKSELELEFELPKKIN